MSQVYSISQLAKLTTLDRRTVTERLRKITAVPGPNRSKVYTLEDALPALIQGEQTALEEAKLERAQAEAALKKLQLEREKGDVISVSVIKENLQDLFKQLHQRVKRLPRDISTQLYKAESPEQISLILGRETDRIFNELRRDHKAFR